MLLATGQHAVEGGLGADRVHERVDVAREGGRVEVDDDAARPGDATAVASRPSLRSSMAVAPAAAASGPASSGGSGRR